jgi:replicative DNA helicase
MENKSVKRRRGSLDLSTMVYGKVPPQAKDLEEAVLGAIMLEKAALDTVIEFLAPERFYVHAHQTIFAAMCKLHMKMQAIDILTVIEELKTEGKLEEVGGPYYVTRLTNAVVSAANIEAHARIILQKFVQREVIRMSGELIGEAYDDMDVFDLMDLAEEKVIGLTGMLHKKNYSAVDELLVKGVQRIEQMRIEKLDITGVPSGFPSIDKLTHGWQSTDFIVIAARPSVGKTAFALNLARNAAMSPYNKTSVAFFSLEMSSGQLIQRLMSAESEIYIERIQRGQLDDESMRQLYEKGILPLGQARIFIDDQGALNIFELRAKIRRLKSKEGIGLVIIDYLQLMSGVGGKGGNREQEISQISRSLKGLAKELEIPIIALSQLSRAVESRGGEKMPMLSDLRESGAIEQDADVVVFLYRPEYYGIAKSADGTSTVGETHIRFAKHRNGSLDTITLQGKLWIQKFVEQPKGQYALPSEENSGKLLTGANMWKAVPGADFTDYKSKAAGEDNKE